MKDETVPETNPDEDNEMPKLTVLDDHEEMMKGRQKETAFLHADVDQDLYNHQNQTSGVTQD